MREKEKLQRLVKRKKMISRNVKFVWRWFIQYWKTCTVYVPTHSPVNAAVAHDDVCGSQT